MNNKSLTQGLDFYPVTGAAEVNLRSKPVLRQVLKSAQITSSVVGSFVMGEVFLHLCDRAASK